MIDVGSLIFVRGHRAVVTGITRYGYYHPSRGAAELLHIYYLSGIRDNVPASIPMTLLSNGLACDIDRAPFRQLICVNGVVGRLVGRDSRGFVVDIAPTEIRPILRTFAPGASCIVITDESAVSA